MIGMDKLQCYKSMEIAARHLPGAAWYGMAWGSWDQTAGGAQATLHVILFNKGLA